MKHLKVIQCPSVDDAAGNFTHEACRVAACTFWVGSQCSASIETEKHYESLLDKFPTPRDCNLASTCRWHTQALKQGKSACVVRRLGEVCEHQGGEWSTFDMAPADEWGVG